MKPKSELTRAVKSPKGDISIDSAGKKPGRGAYFCQNTDCLKKVIKSNALARAFKTKISEEIVEEIQKQLQKEQGNY